jgi:putative ABC transport system ATP-binding protein
LATALILAPKILFADEPTANLDNESSKIVMKILGELHEQGQTIVMVTHEEEYGSKAQRIIRLDDGQIVKIEKN